MKNLKYKTVQEIIHIKYNSLMAFIEKTLIMEKTNDCMRIKMVIGEWKYAYKLHNVIRMCTCCTYIEQYVFYVFWYEGASCEVRVK